MMESGIDIVLYFVSLCLFGIGIGLITSSVDKQSIAEQTEYELIAAGIVIFGELFTKIAGLLLVLASGLYLLVSLDDAVISPIAASATVYTLITITLWTIALYVLLAPHVDSLSSKRLDTDPYAGAVLAIAFFGLSLLFVLQ